MSQYDDLSEECKELGKKLDLLLKEKEKLIASLWQFRDVWEETLAINHKFEDVRAEPISKDKPVK